jgi:hypothetical protein
MHEEWGAWDLSVSPHARPIRRMTVVVYPGLVRLCANSWIPSDPSIRLLFSLLLWHELGHVVIDCFGPPAARPGDSYLANLLARPEK